MAELTQSARLAAMIDHTLLKPEATRAEIEKLCAEAKQFSFASVCVQPYRVALAVDLLKDTSVKICSVIGFPFGANRAEVKAMEVVRAVADGAQELDMVLNIGAFKDGNRAACENDIKGVVKAAQDRTVKVILETALLDHFEIAEACKIAESAGAHYVKTSTGFSRAGATVDHVRLMRKTVGDRLGVKASGGIRDLETFFAMVEAGASRIGTSHGVAILSGLTGQGDY
jgi:deoxyribose-phosphate aldolase